MGVDSTRSACYTVVCTHKAVNAHMTDEQTERLQMRVSKDFIKILDAWRRKQEDLPGRSEAVRRLVELGLKAKGSQ